MRSDLLELYKVHIADLTTRTASVLASTGYDSVIIHSGSLIKRSQFDDQFWPLRPVPHFQHWAHLPWPDCALHLVQGNLPELLCLRDTSFWERPPEPDFAALNAALDVVDVKSVEAIGARLKQGKVAFIGEDRARAGTWGIDEEHINPTAVLRGLDELRVEKTAYEIACLAEANRIACLGHKAVAKVFEGGERSELLLHLAYLQATSQDDPQTPYKNIVAIGENAAILHHVHYRRSSTESPVQSLLLDAGATFQGYASDITRTYAAGGDGAGITAFNQLIDGLERLQQAVCDEVTVGTPYEQLHDGAHVKLGGVLKDAGVLSMSVDEAVDSGVTRLFLPHGLGHSLGLQCHDVGCAKIKPKENNPWLRNTRTVAPNQVFTIEPGVYFIDTFMDDLRARPEGKDVDWKLVEALSAFGGIRIEDDVLVNASDDTPVRNMTREFL